MAGFGNMLRLRVISAVVITPFALIATIASPFWMAIGVVIAFGIASIEFAQLVARRDHPASASLIILWVAVLTFDRVFPELGLREPGISILLVLTLGWSLIRFRQGAANAATGFAMMVAGGFYLGWSGGQLIAIRALEPNGLYWAVTILFAVWASDSFAYFAGRLFGHNLLAQDISPRKTWEGYFGGIVGAALFTMGLTFVWPYLSASGAASPLHGLMLGLLVSIVGPLGDLGISMFKRYSGAKDSGQIIPGHGGFLDRIDALTIGALLGYPYIVLIAMRLPF